MDYTVTEADEGLRVRDVARRRLGVSYTAFQTAKWHDGLRLNGQECRADARVHAGDAVTVLMPEIQPAALPRPWDIPLNIPYQDEHLLIIDKPAPMPSQLGKQPDHHTLENAVFAYLGCPNDFIYRPVNRLDKGTSGLMAVALSAHAQQLMQRQLHTPAFRRIYLAVTAGLPSGDEGVIDLPIAKEDAASIRRVVTPSGKPCLTHYRVLHRDAALRRSLVRLELETGRTHQIRVHLSHLGCPVFGDFLYGEESPLLPGRFALHSSRLILRHPLTGETLCFTSPLPPALAALLPGWPPSAR